MAKNLLLVESPAKARTINKYLGKDFEVLATYGHVRDLRPKEGAVEPDHEFLMHYEPIERNQRHVDAIVKSMRRAEALYLATDPDREGEAISWHVVELLKQRKVLKDKPVMRVVFHEITKRAVQEAIEHPRELQNDLIDAQQARRALDYLVGFNLSPLLWRKIRRGLSAGRVQSPALRMIVEREEEIEAFVAREYWTLEAHLGAEQAFTARLTHYQGEKLEQFTVNNERDAFAIQAALRVQAAGRLVVDKIDKRQRRRNPSPPFTTSTLQQDASRRLGFTAQRTMRVAQQLYEGLEGTEGLGGLITYMRTDSVTLAQDAVAEIREFIAERYGNDSVPEAARVFRTRTKNAQEAHEAIRPTSAQATPESLKGRLNGDQMKLYELIWRRTVACQMEAAKIDTVAVDFACGEGNVFRANGSMVVSPGFLAVYEEAADGKKDEDKRLPALEKGQAVALNDLAADQHFTEPPPRYNEASLVRSLEEHGIGRPSTYAAIISTLQQREYVELIKRRFHPTDVGRVVSRFLTGHFSRYVDYDFTARLEDDLDAISRGEKAWVPVMEAFWHDFHDQVVDKDASVKRSDVTQEPIDEKCPDCGGQLAIRLGRRGRFIGCTKYPECSYTRSLGGDGDEAAQPETVEGRSCPTCESALVIRDGKYGKFIGCSSYPECTYLEPIEKPKDTEVGCPKCNGGTLLQRRSRRGKQFYSCSTFPKCDYAVWNEPLAESCPSCDWPVLTLKTTKRRGAEKVCPQKECGYVAPADESSDADGDSSGEVAFSEAG